MNLIQYARLHQSEVFTKTSVLESNESHNRDRVSRKRRDGDRSGPRKLFNTAHLKGKRVSDDVAVEVLVGCKPQHQGAIPIGAGLAVVPSMPEGGNRRATSSRTVAACFCRLWR